MDDLISRKALIEQLESHIYWGDSVIGLLEVAKNAPTIDAEPVRHGRWEWKTEDVYMCESCGEKVHVKEVMGKPDWSYCPNCGAKMGGEGE